MRELERSINKKWPSLLFDDPSFENNDNDGIISYVYKASPIHVSFKKGAVVTKVPMRLKIKYRARYPIDMSFLFFDRTIIIDQEQEFLFDINVDFRTRAALDQSLEAQSYTDYKVDWITYPYFELYGFIRFRVTKAVEKILNVILEDYGREIDAAVMDNLKVRQYLGKLSKSFEGPFLLDNKTGLWGKFSFQPDLNISQIILSPKRAIVINFATGGKMLLAIDKNEKRVKRLLGEKKPFRFSSEMRDIEREQFFIDSEVNISLSQLQNFVFQQISTGQFVVGDGKKAMRISELYFDVAKNKKSGEYNLVADVHLHRVEEASTSSSMRLKLSFVPFLDHKQRLLRMQDVDFELISENRLLLVASILAKQDFRQTLTKKVTLSIENYLGNIQGYLNKSLYQREINENLNLKVRVWSTKIKDISLLKEHINIKFAIKGRMTFYLKNLF